MRVSPTTRHYPGERGRRNISSWTWRTSCWFCWWAPWWSTLVSSPLTRIRTLTSRPVCSLRHPVLQLRLQDSQRWRAGGTPWRRLEILLRLRQSKRHRDRLQSALRLLCFHEGIDRQVSTIPVSPWKFDDMMTCDVQSQRDLRHQLHRTDRETQLRVWPGRGGGETSLLQWTPKLLLQRRRRHLPQPRQHLNNHWHRGLLLLQWQVGKFTRYF